MHKILNQDYSVGFGFMLWKPYIIRRELERLSDDDILVWSDAGAFVYPDAKLGARLQKHFRALYQLPVGLCANYAIARPHSYLLCKEEAFVALGASEEDRSRRQYASRRIMCRKHPPAMRIIRYWAALVDEQHYWLFDESSQKPAPLDFQGHFHDQASLSILMHRYGGCFWQDHNRIFVRDRNILAHARFLLTNHGPKPKWWADSRDDKRKQPRKRQKLLRQWAELQRRRGLGAV